MDEDTLEALIAEALFRRLIEAGVSEDFAKSCARGFARARSDRMVIANTGAGVAIGVTRSESPDRPSPPLVTKSTQRSSRGSR
jgi:hypothetical protein